MIGILIAVVLAAVVYFLCLALSLPAIAAVLVLLSAAGTGGYGLGHRGFGGRGFGGRRV